jgi:S-adenosylmethionine hydrolase
LSHSRYKASALSAGRPRRRGLSRLRPGEDNANLAAKPPAKGLSEAGGPVGPLLTLLTDFGTRDAFVGVMKGVILGICPQARLVDLSHDVSPHDVEEAAFILETAYRHFPRGTIHLVVVDPGVGGERRPVAVRAAGQVFVAPDNGVLSYWLEGHALEAAVAIANPAAMLPQVSRTFHARDVFAPAAARVAAGMALQQLGPPVSDLCRFDVSRPTVAPDRIEARVIHCDRFGNAITDLDEPTFLAWLGTGDERGVRVSAGTAQISGVTQAYSAVPDGEPLVIFGSTDRLEIAVNGDSACAAYDLLRGEPVVIERAPC